MLNLQALPAREPGFIEPMECLAVTQLPEGADWVYEVKLDGYRAVAVKAKRTPSLYRNGSSRTPLPLRSMGPASRSSFNAF
jgi:ATP-dependent DNA ligase